MATPETTPQETLETATSSLHPPETGGQDQEVLPLAQRRTRRTIRLPHRFRDDIPQPLASLPPQQPTLPEDVDATLAGTIEEEPSVSRPRMRPLDSPHNVFQIFRRYNAVKFPSHDPDEGLPLAQFSNIQTTDTSFYSPYPNKSSFLLGEWFWRDGAQKSVKDFNALLQVLKDPEFSLDDIQGTRWPSLNKRLGGSDQIKTPLDAGWMQESISLVVPFYKTLPGKGNHKFEAGSFHRRSIVSVIRERLASADGQHFHFEPYELHWQPRLGDPPIRVFGELYTSPEFLRAHEELQSCPPEPGCDLPRVVVGLMFASDVTHLTQFGDVKLWPVYMYFGNDSKYRRCKPSCHLCNHIAYLQKVVLFEFIKIQRLMFP